MKKYMKLSVLLLASLLTSCRWPGTSEKPRTSSSSEATTGETTSVSSESSSSSASFTRLETVKNVRIEDNFLKWDAVNEATHYNVEIVSTSAEIERKTVYGETKLDLMSLERVYTKPAVTTIIARNENGASVPSDAFTIICIDDVYYEFYSAPFVITYENFSVEGYELHWETNADITEINMEGERTRIALQKYINLPDYIKSDGLFELRLTGRVLRKASPEISVKIIREKSLFYLFDENLTLDAPYLNREGTVVTIVPQGLYNNFSVSIGEHTFTTTELDFDLNDYAEYMSEEEFAVSVRAAYDDVLFSEPVTLYLKYIDGVIYDAAE